MSVPVSVSVSVPVTVRFGRERLHEPVEPHDARRLHEHGRGRRQQRLDRGARGLAVGKRLRAGAISRRRLARELAYREEGIAATARVVADFPMQRARLGSELGHVAEHENPRAAEHGEIVQSRAHRARVRVVAVVDERRAAAPRERLEPAAHGRRAAQAGHDVVAAHADGFRGRGRGERVRDVLPAEQRQAHVELLAVRQAHSKVRTRRIEVGLADNGAVGALARSRTSP